MEYLNYKHTRMPTEPTHESFLDQIGEFVKSVNFVFLALIYPLGKYIDKYFEYKKSKDREFIKSAAKEGIREEMIAVNTKIDRIDERLDEIVKQAETDRRDTNKQLMDIIKEQKK